MALTAKNGFFVGIDKPQSRDNYQSGLHFFENYEAA